jgi:hypothetical protein
MTKLLVFTCIRPRLHRGAKTDFIDNSKLLSFGQFFFLIFSGEWGGAGEGVYRRVYDSI